MEIIEAVKKHKGKPFEIPDVSRDDLPKFFVKMGYKKGAEIGVWKGQFSEKFCMAGLNLYAIDPWLNYPDYQNCQGQEKINSEYEKAKKTLSPYKNCQIIKKTSMSAVGDFKDKSLDFVYIDGNHLLKYVIQDLCEWSKKVRCGGTISGHDFFYEKREHFNLIHVPFALNAFIGAYNITNWYVLGRKKRIKGEKRDKWRSWMFIKNYKEPSSSVRT